MRAAFGSAIALASAAFLGVGVLLVTAVPTVACSCVAPQPMAAYADNDSTVIFTGVVQQPDGRGVPVKVTRWFLGPEATSTVWLARNGFEESSSSCGTPRPPAGSEWIFVAYVSEGRELGVNLCSPHARFTTPEGEAMFAEAIATFGEGIDPAPPDAIATSGEPVASDEPASAPTPAAPDTIDPGGLPIVLITVGAVVLFMVLGQLVLMRRRRRPIDGG